MREVQINFYWEEEYNIILNFEKAYYLESEIYASDSYITNFRKQANEINRSFLLGRDRSSCKDFR